MVDHGVELAVFEAQHRAQIVRGRLEELRARHHGPVRAGGKPPHTGPGRPGRGELYRVSDAALGRFVAALPRQWSVGEIELDDGRRVLGCIAAEN